MKLRIGMHGDRRVTKNTRGRPFCGLGAFVGSGPTARAHVYTAANLDEITLDSHKKMDPVRLAKQFEVDMCAVNGGRFWLMDETDVQGGDVVNFDGVNLLYGGEMTAAEMMAQMAKAVLAQPDLPQQQLDLARRHAGAPAARARTARCG